MLFFKTFLSDLYHPSKDGRFKSFSGVDIKKVKYGELSWEKVEELIVNGIEEIERLSQKTISKYNKKLVDRLILSCYNV